MLKSFTDQGAVQPACAAVGVMDDAETLGPLCVNMTSEAPKSLPLVHHLPSIEAGVLLNRFAGFAELLLVDLVFVLVVELEVFAGFAGLGFVAAESEVLPPPGWAAAYPFVRTSSAAIVNNRSGNILSILHRPTCG